MCRGVIPQGCNAHDSCQRNAACGGEYIESMGIRDEHVDSCKAAKKIDEISNITNLQLHALFGCGPGGNRMGEGEGGGPTWANKAISESCQHLELPTLGTN